jgi:hypothetical protein
MFKVSYAKNTCWSGAVWFGFSALIPFFILLVIYGRSIFSVPFEVYISCFFVALISGFFGAKESVRFLTIKNYGRSGFWLAIKFGWVIAGKTALYSAVIIGFFSPIVFYKENEQLHLLLQMFGAIFFYVIGGLMFSWLILAIGGLSGVLFFLLQRLINRNK